jgi:environmental stress-induced protein Ves
MAWKNGLGVTTELWREPPGDGDFRWRVSVAEVGADGPFSAFPGCDRMILVLAGAGMTLRHPELGRTVTLEPLVPYGFSGDWPTEGALLDGPVRDFNLISERVGLRSDLEVVQLVPGEHVELAVDAVFLYCLRGGLTTNDAEEPGDAVVLGPGDSVLLRPDGRRATAGAETPTVAIVARVGPR